MKKPWQEGYSSGLQDGVLGKDSKIKKRTNGPFISIFDMEVKQAYDKGYLVGYENGKREKRSLDKVGDDSQKNFENGYSDGFKNGALGKKLKVKEEKLEGSYERGYVVGHLNGKRQFLATL